MVKPALAQLLKTLKNREIRKTICRKYRILFPTQLEDTLFCKMFQIK